MKKQVCIFDFGNVLARFDEMKMTKTYLPNQSDAEMVARVLFDRQYWDQLDCGAMTDETCLSAVRARLPEQFHQTAEDIYTHWYAHMPEISGMRELLHELKKKGIRLFLLSNISVGFEKGYSTVPSLATLLDCFEGRVFSGSIGMVKPQPQIYRYLLNRFQLQPEECIFIDDSERNVAGAETVGITGIVFRNDVEQLRQRLYALMADR